MSPSASNSLSTPLSRTAVLQQQQQQHRDGYFDLQDGMMNLMRQQHLPYSNQSSPVDRASLSSRGSVRPDGAGSGRGGSGSASSSIASIGSHAEFAGASMAATRTMSYGSYYHHHQQSHHVEGGGPAGCGYYLDRGNGQFTRLIPADMLPPMADVVAREEEHESMVILPLLEQLPALGGGGGGKGGNGGGFSTHKSLALPDHLQHQIDCIVATSPKPSNKRVKVYCDKWIHEGVCAFTQQGCKFKHEMPTDEATQRSLGLFHGFPAWWKKRAEEQHRRDLAAGGSNGGDSSSAAVPFFSGLSSPAPLIEAAGFGGAARLRSASSRLGLEKQHQGGGGHDRSLSHHRLPGLTGDDTVGFGPGGAFASAQAGRRGGLRESGSQWMQNGIVPFVRGPGRAF